MQNNALNDGLVLLALSVVIVWVLKRVKLTPILGYLFVGVLVSPYALGWFPEAKSIELLAEIGVVFLLFMIGLEFSISRLVAMRNTVFGLGSVQVLISTLSGGLIAWMTGIQWQAALVVGGALALSSTAIVAKQLSDQLEMQGRHGQLAIGILLFQDLAVVPLLVVIPILSNGSNQSMLIPLFIAMAKGIVAFYIMYGTGRRLLRPFYHLVASTHSAEIFTLATLLVSLAAAWLTHQLDLSLALGAFLAGLMLSETEYRHQIQTDIRPFRDVLMGLFFISVGAQLDIAILSRAWLWVGLLTAGLIIGKGGLIIMMTKTAGHDWPVAFRTGLVLGQAGEFSFAILVVTISNQLLTLEEIQPIIASIILSMLISPLLIRYNSQFAEMLFRGKYVSDMNVPPRDLEQACADVSNHVIICGFGRIGQNLANILREMKISYVALDLDHSLIREAWEAGEKVYYGDSTQLNILKKADIKNASALVITFDESRVAEQIILASRSICETVPIIVRSKDERHMELLQEKGASNVVPESFEASMMLAIHLLKQLGVSTEESMSFVEQARRDDYKRLRGYFRGEEALSIEESEVLRFHTVTLSPESYAVNKTIAAIHFEINDTCLIAVRRGHERIEQFNRQFIFQSGDAIVIEGKPDATLLTEKRLLSG